MTDSSAPPGPRQGQGASTPSDAAITPPTPSSADRAALDAEIASLVSASGSLTTSRHGRQVVSVPLPHLSGTRDRIEGVLDADEARGYGALPGFRGPPAFAPPPKGPPPPQPSALPPSPPGGVLAPVLPQAQPNGGALGEKLTGLTEDIKALEEMIEQKKEEILRASMASDVPEFWSKNPFGVGAEDDADDVVREVVEQSDFELAQQAKDAEDRAAAYGAEAARRTHRQQKKIASAAKTIYREASAQSDAMTDNAFSGDPPSCPACDGSGEQGGLSGSQMVSCSECFGSGLDRSGPFPDSVSATEGASDFSALEDRPAIPVPNGAPPWAGAGTVHTYGGFVIFDYPNGRRSVTTKAQLEEDAKSHDRWATEDAARKEKAGPALYSDPHNAPGPDDAKLAKQVGIARGVHLCATCKHSVQFVAPFVNPSGHDVFHQVRTLCSKVFDEDGESLQLNETPVQYCSAHTLDLRRAAWRWTERNAETSPVAKFFLPIIRTIVRSY